MKVVFVNTSDRKGGAAVACLRLAQAMRKAGVDVSVLVLHKQTDLSYVYALDHSFKNKLQSKFSFYAERLQLFLANGLTRKDLFAVSTARFGFDISNHPLIQQADIVHLHWVNQGFLSLRGIDQLIRSGKRIVWTLHDLWPMTGICHYPHTCDRYKSDCGKCLFLHQDRKSDLSSVVFKKKLKLLSGAGIHFVSCSQWLGNEAQESLMTGGNSVVAIPNPIDTDLFMPGDSVEARKALGLPLDKKLVLFGAAIASDERKGMRYLMEASHKLSDLKEEVALVMFGEIKGITDLQSHFGLPVYSIGYLSDMHQIIRAYQAVDLLVTPSLEDNLPNLIMEAMACGTPCVGFEVGGIPEMIKHNHTGYVAKAKSAEDLACGIKKILYIGKPNAMKTAVRNFVLENYDEAVVSEKYKRLYEQVLDKNYTTYEKKSHVLNSNR